ncbi:hypothetical protein ACFQ49_16380 [Kroppenstedtia eburnea]|uniref:hypothetical protein n=1 Tax=Kroppenstedtia eburnea TaxID=714067 RepID=UPI003645E807
MRKKHPSRIKSFSLRFLLFILLLTFLSPQGKMFAQPVLHKGNQVLESWRIRDYQQWSGKNVIVTYHSGFRNQAKLVAQEMDRVLAGFEKEYGFDPGRPVPVFLFPDRTSLQDHFSWDEDQSATGVYFSGAIYLLNPQVWSEEFPSAELEPTRWALLFHKQGPLYHETAHFYLDRYTGGNYPLWYTEAFAQWVEYRELGYQWVVPANDPSRHPLYEYRELADRFQQLPNQALAYRQSFLWLRWMVEAHGDSSLDRLHHRLSRGIPFDSAWKQVFGSSPGESFEEWRRQTT